MSSLLGAYQLFPIGSYGEVYSSFGNNAIKINASTKIVSGSIVVTANDFITS